jgi:hypothetical protein
MSIRGGPIPSETGSALISPKLLKSPPLYATQDKKGDTFLNNTFQTKVIEGHYVKVKVTQIIPYM